MSCSRCKDNLANHTIVYWRDARPFCKTCDLAFHNEQFVERLLSKIKKAEDEREQYLEVISKIAQQVNELKEALQAARYRA